MTHRCYIGIDGGGSKTDAALIYEDGTVIATAAGPTSAIYGKPHSGACSVLAELTESLLGDAGLRIEDVDRYCIGLSGVDLEWEFQEQWEIIATALGISKGRLTLVNDGLAALWGAAPGPRIAILQVGTGFTAAYRANYGNEVLFDHLDTGRMYDIREELMVVISRMIDGRVERTGLVETVLEFFELKREEDFGPYLYGRRIPKSHIRRTPPLIYAAWENGDPVASAIMNAAAQDYILTARTMIQRMGSGGGSVVFGGGVIRCAPDRLWTMLREGVNRNHPDFLVHSPVLAPSYGAALLAAYQADRNPVGRFNRIKAQIDARDRDLQTPGPRSLDPAQPC